MSVVDNHPAAQLTDDDLRAISAESGALAVFAWAVFVLGMLLIASGMIGDNHKPSPKQPHDGPSHVHRKVTV